MSTLETMLAAYFAQPRPHKLELGAGSNGKPGWLSTDLEEHFNPNGTFTIGLDATKPFPLPDACFDYIYCEHMIEHLSFGDGQTMLRECLRVLRPHGVIRVVTPSLGLLLQVMSSDPGLVERSYKEWSVRTFVPEAPAITNAFFLNNFVRAWGHTFIYDHDTLVLAMTMGGFGNLTEFMLGQSNHPDLAGLEFAERLPPGFLALESMIVEGTKEA